MIINEWRALSDIHKANDLNEKFFEYFESLASVLMKVVYKNE